MTGESQSGDVTGEPGYTIGGPNALVKHIFSDGDPLCGQNFGDEFKERFESAQGRRQPADELNRDGDLLILGMGFCKKCRRIYLERHQDGVAAVFQEVEGVA